MSEDPRFRPAGLDDRAILVELQRRASLMNEADREWVLANPGMIDIPPEQLTPATAVVAESGGVAVGFAIVLPRPAGDAELDGVFVEPTRFRSGIGRALIAQAELLAKAMGARVLYVVANSASAGFYEALGFEQYDMVPTLLRLTPAMRKRIGFDDGERALISDEVEAAVVALEVKD